MMGLKPIFFIMILNLMLASCGVQAIRSATGAQSLQQERAEEAAGPTYVPDLCPTTRPQNPLFTPPMPWPAKAPYGQFWYGSAALWTALPPDGKWLGLSQKIWFWRQGYNGAVEPQPKLQVTGRRLDAPGQTFEGQNPTNGFHPDFNWAMMVGADIPANGCWQIRGSIEGHELSFVVSVGP